MLATKFGIVCHKFYIRDLVSGLVRWARPALLDLSLAGAVLLRSLLRGTVALEGEFRTPQLLPRALHLRFATHKSEVLLNDVYIFVSGINLPAVQDATLSGLCCSCLYIRRSFARVCIRARRPLR